MNSDSESGHSGPVIYYNKKVLAHLIDPQNVGEMKDGEASGFADTGDPACGDNLLLWIRVEDHRIVDIKFKCFGCPAAIATSSVLTVLARGKTLDEAKRITDDDVVSALDGVPEKKKHCSLLGVTGLHNAIADYEKKSENT